MKINFETPSENVRVFSAFCDETRLKVLELLQSGEKCAGVLLEQVNIRQSTLSHHMKILTESGIVRARKAGKWTYYSISESGVKYAAGLLDRITGCSITNKITEKKESAIMNMNNLKNFSIMVDTSCDLPPGFAEKHGIEKLPITFELDGVPHNGGYWQEISDKDFYGTLKNGGIAKTAQVNPEGFYGVFTEYAKAGKELLFLLLSSAISGTYQSSQIALAEVRETYPDCKIYVIDSLSAAVGMGLLAVMAVEKRSQGMSVAETAAFLEEKKHSCLGLFTVNDLMYLHRGGRLSKLSAVAGSVLKVKPMLNIQPAGNLAVKDKARGRKASIEMLAEQFKRSINPGTILDVVYVAHSDCENDAQVLAEMLNKTGVSIKQVVTTVIGPVIGAHVGPGALALFFEADMSREEYEKKFYPGK